MFLFDRLDDGWAARTMLAWSLRVEITGIDQSQARCLTFQLPGSRSLSACLALDRHISDRVSRTANSVDSANYQSDREVA